MQQFVPPSVPPLAVQWPGLSMAGAILRQMTWAGHAAPRSTAGWQDDQQFVALMNAYRSSGGLARAQEVLELFVRRGGPDVATLARWVVQRDVLSFDWHTDNWMPLFQFDPADMRPLPQLRPVLAELTGVYSAWELAEWFTEPNAWLQGATPADRLGRDAAGVLDAARADRFVANG